MRRKKGDEGHMYVGGQTRENGEGDGGREKEEIEKKEEEK